MRNTESHLAVRAIRPLVSGLRALGHDPAPIMASIGLEAATLDDPDARVAMTMGVALLARAVEVTRDTNLGLHLAEHADLDSFGSHYYTMMSSPTLGEAYERLCRYQRLIHDTTRVVLEKEEHDRVTLRHLMPGGLAAPRQSAEFIVAAWVRAGREAVGTSWSPVEVRFAHAGPEDVREHSRFFRAPVRFTTGENALVLQQALLETPCVRADRSLLSVLDGYAEDRLARTPSAATFADRVRAALGEELRGNEVRAAQVAVRLKMSVRTLNRTLAAEGTSYRELFDQLRQELATRHLAEQHISIAEVAFLLGFAEISAFHRAFKRWTGRTPAEFRREQQPPR